MSPTSDPVPGVDPDPIRQTRWRHLATLGKRPKRYTFTVVRGELFIPATTTGRNSAIPHHPELIEFLQEQGDVLHRAADEVWIILGEPDDLKEELNRRLDAASESRP